MTKDEADALCGLLKAKRIGHELKAVFILNSAHYSVRADLKPAHYDDDRSTREYARNVLDIMTVTGDWAIGGELGRAFVSRY